MRRALTLPEGLLWQALRTRPDGLKFRRQHPAGSYVLDFYCAWARLAVEVDGQVHADPGRASHDRRRSAWLATHGIRAMRIPATAVLDDLAGVVAGIATNASPSQPLHHAPHGPPPPAGEEFTELHR